MIHLPNQNKLKIGIIFNFQASWMGGVIYILNVIKILNFLNDEEKPEIILFYNPDLKKFVDQISYPYLQAVEWNFPNIYNGYIKSWLTGKNVFIKDIIKRYELNGLYPLHDYPVKTITSTKLVSWYADLQHEYYPEFFSRKKIIERTLRIKFILKNSGDLVVSSQAVMNDFEKFFGLRKGIKVHIFHFVSVVDDFSELDIKKIREKYELPQKYYMISNQFHKHKNHKVLLDAMVKLKNKGLNIHMAMTGRFPDATHSPYMQELHSIINEHKLHPQISLLGIIPRNEQLLLMKHSQAVLQPSLFEGWSTVIEDAISVQVPVVASNLPVNIEQLGPDGVYFEPHNSDELTAILANYPERNLNDLFYEDYFLRVKEAAHILMKIIT
ncbi:MAG: glycosyltransferase family 4 protein [Bacteroidales bacterium]|nr:glycosyltransferase family 4 protein [Bacteroidales bacterium]MCF8390255.1 glycosyltransferase family 4 protein [Bacteroidales bacterium]